LTDFSEVLTASVITEMIAMMTLMMEAVSTSETSVIIYQTTWCSIPEMTMIMELVMSKDDTYSGYICL
jgi:hypothetical protein